MRKFLLSLLLTATALPAFAQDILLKDANIVIEDKLQRDVDVLIIDGELALMQADIQAPDGAEVIVGAWVTPPLFAPLSTLGLVEIGNAGRTNDSSADEAETSVSEKASDSFNPRSVHIANTRRRGVGYAVVSPNTSGDSIFAGTGMIATLDSDLFTQHITEAFVRVDLGETGTDRAGGSRAAAMRQLRAALNDAGAYPGRYKSPTDGDALTRQDAAALVKVVRGQIPLLITANRASDLLTLTRLQLEFPRLSIIVIGGAESWQVTDALKTAKIKVIIDPLDNLPTQFEKIGSRLDLATLLDEAGVDFAIANLTSLGVAKPTSLNQHAGNAVGQGLAWDKAFAAISTIPADWFDMGDIRTAPNDPLSIVVWDGDPLEVTSAPTHMWLGGKAMSLESRQTKLRDRYNPASNDTRPHKYR